MFRIKKITVSYKRGRLMIGWRFRELVPIFDLVDYMFNVAETSDEIVRLA